MALQCNCMDNSVGYSNLQFIMLKRKKPQMKHQRRRQALVAAGRRRIKRHSAVAKIHQRRRHYLGLIEPQPAA